ncbi:XRE family transcriptional regulator [Rhodovulum sp. MB263]|uniref:XRE family transcriptional regulator n=1 Tax=Rhodovulum sp. (strain MB263) TaxID=308754 RepID=UPI00351810B8
MIAERLKALIEDRGTNNRAVALAAGMGPTGVRDIISRKTRSPTYANLLKIADVLGVDVQEITGGHREQPSIAIAGKVGASARVPVFDTYEKGDGPQVECPPGLSPHNIVAVEIEGDSMEPVYSAGDLLFYTRWSDGSVPSEAVGKRCVCECEEGLGWVKLVRQGRDHGTFDLHSFNDQTPTMYGVRLKWAAPIKLHWPAELARKV